MRPIGNSPREATVLRLEQAKSFSFGVQFLEEGRNPIDVTDCEVRLTTPTFEVTAAHTTPGSVRIDIQASHVQKAGNTPYAVTLVTANGYSATVLKGTLEVISNPDFTIDTYSALTPPTGVEVYLRGTQVVQIAAAPQLPPSMTGARAALIDERGHLILTLEDGTQFDVGLVRGPQGLPGADGSDGSNAVTLYTWTKYADTPYSGMTDSPDGKVYRGIATNKTSPVESNNYEDYTWERIAGPPGTPGMDGSPGIPGADGQDGTSLYTWLKYADTPTSGMSDNPEGKRYIGFAYNKANPTESNDYADYLWSIVEGQDGVPGPPGVDGETYFTWIRYADSPISGMSDNPEGKAYLGIAYNKTTPTESSNYADYKWSKIEGDDGPQGIQGPPGSDGVQLYTWIRYADTPTTGMSNLPDGKTYLGIAYNKTTPTESSNYADYKWSKIEGDDGPQGIQGPPGNAGQTLYTWVRYADTPTTGMSNLPDGKAYLGIAYNKTTPTESSNYADYKWSSIEAQEGVQGPPGADGATYYTWIKYADTPTSGMSDSSTGKLYLGLAYNKTTPTESTAYADYQWSKIRGDDGIQGPPGADGEPRYTWIKYADTPTSGMSDSATGKSYLGIAYNKLTSVESTAYADYQWSKIRGDDGIQGPPGVDGQTTYTWIKYADTPTSGMSDSATGKSYLGIAYNKMTSVESTDYADYQWSKIEGPQGVPGVPGADGQTMYTWVKYAYGPNGEGLSDYSTDRAYIGLAYNKNTPVESTNPADYTWSLFRGIGLSSITPFFMYLPLSTPKPAVPVTFVPPAGWSETEPDFQLFYNLWRTERIAYDNNTWGYTPVSKVTGNFGSNYVAGMVQSATHVGANPPTGDGQPFEGQMWWVTNAINNFAGLRRYNGSSWQNYVVMADSIIAANSISGNLLQVKSVKATNIDVAAVEARHLNVTSESSGRFMSMKPDGLRLWDGATDEESPLVSLTSSSERFFSVGDGQGGLLSSIDSVGTVLGKVVGADDRLTIKGQDVKMLINERPGRILASGKVNIGSIHMDPGMWYMPIRLDFTVPAGRMARLLGSGLRFEYGSGGILYGYVTSWDTYNASGALNPAPSINLSTPDPYLEARSSNDPWTTTLTTSTFFGPDTVDKSYVVVFAVKNDWSTAATQIEGAMSVVVEDLGVADSVNFNSSHVGVLANAPSLTAPAVPPTKTYEQYVNSSSWGSFYGTGAAVGSSSMYYNVVTQGQAPTGSGTQGAARGLWTFPSITSELSGATINAMEIYITNQHTRWAAGATAYLFGHGHSSVPATLGASTSNQITKAFAKGQGTWITIPSSHFASWKSGAIRGYGLYTTGTDNYGYWASGAQLRVKYTK